MENSAKRQAQKFLVTMTAVVAVVAKRAGRLQRKLAAREEWRMELRSAPKKLMNSISAKTLPFMPKKGNSLNSNIKKKKKKKSGEEDTGVWQKTILMGDKCEPLDFSGVIYYDSNGTQVNEMPLRSPRASPVPTGYYFIRHRDRHHNQ